MKKKSSKETETILNCEMCFSVNITTNIDNTTDRISISKNEFTE